LGKIKD